MTSGPEGTKVIPPPSSSRTARSSGMASGGRVVHHLAHLAEDRRNTVVLVGFQAPGTRGFDLAHRATEVNALGRYVRIRCEVAAFDSMSVHADADDLVRWLDGGAARVPPPDVCFVVHGETESARALARLLRDELGWLAVVPHQG